MPRHLISDAHEWINEIPTVPIYYLAKPQRRERASQNQRGKKTLLESGLTGKDDPSGVSLVGALRPRKVSGTEKAPQGQPRGEGSPPNLVVTHARMPPEESARFSPRYEVRAIRAQGGLRSEGA